MNVKQGQYDLTAPIPVWAWNGHNAAWVESCDSREDAENEVEYHKEWLGNRFESIEVIEDGEFFSVLIKERYDFYGARWSDYIVTTRPGRFVEDPDDNLMGDWVPTT